MSKNLTRKGLAFGAMVALGSTLFAGAPALANSSGPLTLLPDGGTRDGATYTSLIGAGITLSSTLDADKQSEASFLDTLVPLNEHAMTLDDYELFRASSADTLDDTGDAAYLAYGASGSLFTVVNDGNAEWPSSWTYNDGITKDPDYRVIGNATLIPAVDPLADAWYVISNPDAHEIYLNVDAENQGYYIYDGDGNAGGNGDTAGVNFVVGEIGDEDYSIATRSGFTVDTGAAGRISAGMQEDVFVDVDVDSGDDFVTNATKIAVRANSDLDDTAGLRTLAPLFIDAADSDQDDEIELTVTVLTDTISDSDATIGKVNNGEYTSATQTVTLLDPASVRVTTVMDSALTTRSGSNANVVAKVTLGNDVNPYAVRNSQNLGVIFYRNGVDMDLTSGTDDGSVDIATEITAGVGSEFALDDTSDIDVIEEDGLVFTGTWETGALSSADYSARAVWTGAEDGDQYAGSRSVVLNLVNGTNADVDDIYATVTDSANLVWDETDTTLVRSGTSAAATTLQIVTTDDTDLDDAGVRVRVTVTATSLDEDSEVTVGATKLADGEDVTYFAFTNSDGQVDVLMTNSGAADGDTVDVTYAALLDDGTYETGTAQTFSWVDAALDPEFEVSPTGILAGSTINVTFTAVDQWGIGMDSTEDGRISFKVEAVVDGNVDEAEYSETEPTKDGAAAFSFANFADEGSNQEIIVYLYQGTTADSGTYFTIYNNLATSAITVADEFETHVQYVDFVTGRYTASAVNTAAEDAGIFAVLNATAGEDYALISGTVLDANNAGQPGAAVTIAADGVLFHDAETATLAKDSITVFANAQGFFDVDVITQRVNAKGATVTITADGKSETTLLKSFLNDSILGSDLKLSWNLPENIVKNTTYSVTATLTDVWGNPVQTAYDEDVSEDGNGEDTPVATISAEGSLLVNGVDDILRNFNDKGQTTFFVRSVTDIAGPASLSLSVPRAFYYYTGDGSQDVSGEDMDVSYEDDPNTSWDESLWSDTLTVDIDVLDQAPVAEGKVNAGSFNGYVAVYAKGFEGQTLSWKIAGKWFKTTVTSDYQVFQRKTIDVGATVNVDLYINGVKLLSKSVLTR